MATSKPTFSFVITTEINAPFTAVYDFYVNPLNIPKVHPFADKVVVTHTSESSVSFVVTDSIPVLCNTVALPVTTHATSTLDTNNSATSKTVLTEGHAPLVKFWASIVFAESPADPGCCTVTETHNNVCPWLFKKFTRAKAYESHLEMHATLKRLLEEQHSSGPAAAAAAAAAERPAS